MKLIFIFLFIMPLVLFGQSPEPLITAFPSLRIPTSSRGLAMGDVGIASGIDNQQVNYNVAKSAFMQNFHQVAVHYSPWMQAISPDTRFLNTSYLGNVFNRSALGISISYLDLGRISERDNNGATLAEYHSKEYNLGVSYALQMNDQASLGLTLRLLGQHLFTKEVYSVCGDLSYYQFITLKDQHQRIEWGAVIYNIGPKLTIEGSDVTTFLPTNLGLSIAYVNTNDNEGSQFTAALDLNKLLVPSKTNGANNKSMLEGMFSSFNEPGQLNKIRLCTGIEYGYRNQFFLRGGMSMENKYQGNRKYIGLGVGYKGLVLDQSWGIDFHYLVPFGKIATVSPFAHAFGFSLQVNFGNFQ